MHNMSKHVALYYNASIFNTFLVHWEIMVICNSDTSYGGVDH